MKKLYENPVIKVSRFHSENILTLSGETPSSNGAEQGANSLASGGYTADQVDVNGLSFTWTGSL